MGILHIHKKTFKLQQRPLQTVRQFYFLDIQLTDHIDEKALKTLSNTKLEQKLDKLLTDTVNIACQKPQSIVSSDNRSLNYSNERKRNILVIQNSRKSRENSSVVPRSLIGLL